MSFSRPLERPQSKARVEIGHIIWLVIVMLPVIHDEQIVWICLRIHFPAGSSGHVWMITSAANGGDVYSNSDPAHRADAARAFKVGEVVMGTRNIAFNACRIVALVCLRGCRGLFQASCYLRNALSKLR
jgi:hypothetical protein